MSERDMQVRIVYGDLTILLNSEGVSHSPDVLDDLTTRAVAMFGECLEQLATRGLVEETDEVQLGAEEDE